MAEILRRARKCRGVKLSWRLPPPLVPARGNHFARHLKIYTLLSKERALKVRAFSASYKPTVRTSDRGESLLGTLHTLPRALFCIERCARLFAIHSICTRSHVLPTFLVPIGCETCQISLPLLTQKRCVAKNLSRTKQHTMWQ